MDEGDTAKHPFLGAAEAKANGRFHWKCPNPGCGATGRLKVEPYECTFTYVCSACENHIHLQLQREPVTCTSCLHFEGIARTQHGGEQLLCGAPFPKRQVKPSAYDAARPIYCGGYSPEEHDFQFIVGETVHMWLPPF